MQPLALALLLAATTMKRIDLIKVGGFKAGENLVASEVPVPPTDSLGPNEVLVQVKATAVNPVDWKQASWGFLLPPELPAALGCDVSGVVVGCGPEASGWMGRRVVCYVGADKSAHATDKGAFVEKVSIGADVVAELPDGMTFSQAATLPVGFFTAAFLLKAISPKQGGWVIVYGGSSSVGFNAVQLAVRKGYKVIAVASAKHESLMKDLGASGFVDYRNDDFNAKVKEIVGQEKLVGAVDCIGDAATFDLCATIVKELGDDSVPLAVSTTGDTGAHSPPAGVSAAPVMFGNALDIPEDRKLVAEWSKEMVTLETMPVRAVRGPFAAETVEEGFQVSKDGVSGQKVVIEWTE
jgi:NADPH:quinone reductase-like Zn-dependent oxidoreductase